MRGTLVYENPLKVGHTTQLYCPKTNFSSWEAAAGWAVVQHNKKTATSKRSRRTCMLQNAVKTQSAFYPNAINTLQMFNPKIKKGQKINCRIYSVILKETFTGSVQVFQKRPAVEARSSYQQPLMISLSHIPSIALIYPKIRCGKNKNKNKKKCTQVPTGEARA